jgi:sporulation protein YlmC with PRC-barrel domain
MTISIIKSELITDIVATPIVLGDKAIGEVKRVLTKIAVPTTSIDEIGDIILLAPVPSNAKIGSIKIFNDDLDSNGSPTLAANVGLYYSGIGNGQRGLAETVVDADCIASAITSLQAAVVLGSEVRFEAANITTIDMEAWELGGLTVDPGGYLHIGLTITTVAATAAAGDIAIMVDYI